MATPAFVKALSRNRLARGLACHAGRRFVRLVYASGRWETLGAEHAAQFWETGTPAIVCFWHGRLMMLPHAWQSPYPFHMLISPHADGRLIACVVEGLGIQTLAGSSRKGGTDALRRLIQIVKGGATIGITPDGPNGPRMRASEGAVALARLTGAPLLPVAFGCTRRRVLRSWDRFVVALPFARGVFVWGAPITVPREADAAALDDARRTLEDRLTAISDEADRLTGQACIDPAPAESVVEPAEAAS